MKKAQKFRAVIDFETTEPVTTAQVELALRDAFRSGRLGYWVEANRRSVFTAAGSMEVIER